MVCCYVPQTMTRGYVGEVSARLLILLCAIGLVLPAAALAQGDEGVTVDPNSPAGKEYALPTDAARRAAGTRASAGDHPLFGVGIAPRGPNSPSSGGGASAGPTTGGAGKTVSQRGSGGSRDAGSTRKRASRTRSVDPTPGLAVRPVDLASPQDGSALWAAGAAVLALLLGALGLSRWRAARPSPR
jgi:hypothetical protein